MTKQSSNYWGLYEQRIACFAELKAALGQIAENAYRRIAVRSFEVVGKEVAR